MTLDLTNLEDSDIKYKLSKFPDGQQTVTIDVEHFATLGLTPDAVIIIKSRLRSFRDLELIISANQDLIGMELENKRQLFVPYFLGARSDRKFQPGSSHYLKTVICPIINSQNFSKVTVLDAHSDVLEACLDHIYKVSNLGLVSFALSHIDEEKDFTVIVSPDAGALKKIYDVAKAFSIANVVTAGKVRNIVTGEILRTEMPDLSAYHDKRYKFIIIDDICDGGRTFNEIKKAIELQIPGATVYLVITHGIFSAGFNELNNNFAGIYCTNSYVDMDEPEFNMANDNKLHKLHQMNVF